MSNLIKSDLFTSQSTVINREVFTILWAKVGILLRQETKRIAIGKKSLQKEETRSPDSPSVTAIQDKIFSCLESPNYNKFPNALFVINIEALIN